MRIIESFKNLKKFEIGLWIFSLLMIIMSFFIFENKDYLTLIVSLIGVSALIFVAKGDVLGQILTVIFSIIYGYISFEFKYYGELITYVGMTLPIALVSIISWLKHPYSTTEVKVASLSKIKMMILILLSLVVTFMFYFILKYFNNKNLIISTISVTTSFLASSLALFRNRFYALAYSLNDIILIVLWTLASLENSMYVPLVVCFIMFFINDIYGFINWTIMKNRQEKEY